MEEERFKSGSFFFVALFFFILILLTALIHPFITIFLLIAYIYAIPKLIKEEKAEIAYKNIRKKITIPEDAQTVTVIDGYGKLISSTHFFWKIEQTIIFFPKEYPKSYSQHKVKQLGSVIINLADIEYYSTKGEFYTETKVSGGDGGGISVGGAVVGGVLGAVVGGKTTAAVGSVLAGRKKVNAVTSETIKHDSRSTSIFINDNGSIQTLKLGFGDYDNLYRVIPQKSYDSVNQVLSMNIVKSNMEIASTSNNIVDKLKTLTQLKSEGFISDLEFEEKKKQILEKI